MAKMEMIPVKTRPILPPQDDLFKILDEFLPQLQERDIVFVTSKIVAIHQGRSIKIDETVDKDTLIKDEAEHWIPREECPGEYVILTVKDYTLIPSAGIDESNANGYYVLWPKHADAAAEEIRNYLLKKSSLNDLAVIITDSHCVPLRRGVVGIATGFAGLEPVKNYVGSEDIFGRKLKMTKVNVVDALAVMGVFAMGEGNEQTPIAILRAMPGIIFTEKSSREDFNIPIEEDIYYPLLKRFLQEK